MSSKTLNVVAVAVAVLAVTGTGRWLARRLLQESATVVRTQKRGT